MKKVFALILALILLLGLSACGETQEEAVSEAPSETTESSVTYRVETENYSDTLTYDDGTVIARYSFDLPRLHACLSDGTEADAAPVDAQADETVKKALDTVAAFNADMDARLADLRDAAEEMFDWAREGYENSLEWEEAWLEAYTKEQTFTVYQTETIVSVCMQCYEYTGGAHPNGGFDTYHFDLAAGERFAYTDLVQDDEKFRETVSCEILSQIWQQDIAEGLYEDYDESVRRLDCAEECYDENGITFIFEEYTIGPHAAGSLMFDIPYGMIANYLNDRGTALLPIKQEDIVLADFYETRELWFCFYICTLPEVNDSEYIELDGNLYRPVDYEGITTMAQLNELLLSHVSESVAEEWLSGGLYREIDGVLCVIGAGRGTDEFEESFTVQLSGDGGRVIETAKHIDYSSREIDGTSTIEYPFILRDGHAVFTAFDCPL